MARQFLAPLRGFAAPSPGTTRRPRTPNRYSPNDFAIITFMTSLVPA